MKNNEEAPRFIGVRHYYPMNQTYLLPVVKNIQYYKEEDMPQEEDSLQLFIQFVNDKLNSMTNSKT